jgi:hypothetical protein
MKTALKIGFCCVLLGGMISGLWYRQRAIDRLTAEIESLRRQTSDLSVLQADNRRLIAAAPDRAEAARKQREELAGLQAQISIWKSQVDTLERRREQASQRPAPSPRPEMPPLVPLPGMMPLGANQNVGRDTPAHLAQTRIWAIAHREWQTLAEVSAYEPEALAQFDAAFAKLSPAEQMKFGNPVRMVTMLAFKSDESSPPSAAQLAGPGLTVAAENVIGPDDVDIVYQLQISADKTRESPPVRVHRFPDGWKFVAPPASAEERKAMLDAIPPTQRKTLGKN